MSGLPAPEPGRVVEGEVVGHERPAPWWRRLLTRAALGLALLLLGLGLSAAGLLLTIIIVGAPLGVPLTVAGVLVMVLASFVLFGGGKLTVIRRR